MIAKNINLKLYNYFIRAEKYCPIPAIYFVLETSNFRFRKLRKNIIWFSVLRNNNNQERFYVGCLNFGRMAWRTTKLGEFRLRLKIQKLSN